GFLSNSKLFGSFLIVPPAIISTGSIHLMKVKLFLFTALLSAVSFASAITSAQRKPANEAPITGDFKITVRNTVAGHSTQSTTMIKGSRERSETAIDAGGFSMKTTSITQCDQRRTIQINDRARKYLITSMYADDSSADATTTAGAPAGTGDSRRGGVVTINMNT